MANFSNTYETSALGGSAASNREDLTDVLTILAPEETPVLSSANKQKASATFVEWTVDSLATPATAGIDEGADVDFAVASSDKFANRARLGNYVQKFRRQYKVSDLQEAVDSVGPAKIAQAEAKSIRELKRDIEATLCGESDRDVEDGANPYLLRGLGKWIEDSTNAGGAGASADIPNAFKTSTASIADVTQAEGTFAESELNSMITSLFKVTGSSNNLMLIADTALRRDISDFARISDSNDASVRNVNYSGESGSIKLSVDLYQSDHGIVSVVNANPDCMPVQAGQAGMAGYVVNPDYYGVHELIPMGSTRLPNLGGGERGFVDCALTLGVYHPGAHGKITASA